MSRTDKTNPSWVQILVRDCKVIEVHNHENGICEIAGQAQPTRDHIETFRGQCYWSWGYDGTQFCGCPICTQQFERKAKNKRRRQESKRIINQQLEEQ